METTSMTERPTKKVKLDYFSVFSDLVSKRMQNDTWQSKNPVLEKSTYHTGSLASDPLCYIKDPVSKILILAYMNAKDYPNFKDCNVFNKDQSKSKKWRFVFEKDDLYIGMYPFLVLKNIYQEYAKGEPGRMILLLYSLKYRSSFKGHSDYAIVNYINLWTPDL